MGSAFPKAFGKWYHKPVVLFEEECWNKEVKVEATEASLCHQEA
jgi:hypothetical protein